jgi:hypothetical protein
MPSALQLIEKIVVDKLFSTPVPLSEIKKAGQGLWTLSIAFLVVGFIFLFYGAHSWLSVYYNEYIAAITIGIVSICLSLSIAGILFAVIYYHTMHIRKSQEKITDQIKFLLSALENELGDPIRENPKMALIIASLVGFLVEDQIFE